MLKQVQHDEPQVGLQFITAKLHSAHFMEALGKHFVL